MNTLWVRVFSAVFFLILFVATYFFWRNDGLFVLSSLAVARVGYEYGRIIFQKKSLNVSFSLLALALFLIYYWRPDQFLMIFALAVTVLLAAFTWQARRGIPLEKIAALQSAATLGLFYCVVLPIFVVDIIFVSPNAFWFPVYLCIVFASDTFAYFAGYFFGKTKLLEAVSPKKTIAGAIGGFIGSLVIAVGVAAAFKVQPLPMVLGTLGAAGLAQLGDLFESLLKRVANVKDSGRFMPGHGGLMDRLDGVYMAAPFFYFILKTYL